jgi:Flp pilus assembly protein TadD
MQERFQEASVLHQSGKLSEAETIYRELLASNNSHPVVSARLAILLLQSQRGREALPLFSQAIEQLPPDAGLLSHAVNLASQLGENDFAENWLKKLMAVQTGNAALANQYAGVLIANHKESEALDLIKQLLKSEPQNANLYNLKGMAQSRLGDGDKAFKSFQKALRLNPGQIGVVRNLIIHGKTRKEPLLEEIMPQYEAKLRQGGLDPAAQMNIAYILSMYYEKRGDADKSFEYLALGNRLNRSSYQYLHADTQKQFKVLMDGITDEFLSEVESVAINDAAPIFIIGMPRSGTTLIEQILSSHSLVSGEGELQTMRQEFEVFGDRILADGDNVEVLKSRASALAQAAKSYLEHVRLMQAQSGRGSCQYFTDKMPYNFMMAGYIAAIFPNAKIIHCTRDPIETCFSVFKQNFSGSHAYSNELIELGQYYTLYQDLMASWNQKFPGRIYEANYEKMVSDSESQIEALLAFCGLDFEPECLMFHKNKRAVRTASVAQVRQPIYKDAVKASKPFEKQLQPLIDAITTGSGRIVRS